MFLFCFRLIFFVIRFDRFSRQVVISTCICPCFYFPVDGVASNSNGFFYIMYAVQLTSKEKNLLNCCHQCFGSGGGIGSGSGTFWVEAEAEAEAIFEN